MIDEKNNKASVNVKKSPLMTTKANIVNFNNVDLSPVE
jgi:hypothetical protein